MDEENKASSSRIFFQPPEFAVQKLCVSKVLCVCWISFCKVFFNIDICILYLQHLSLYFHIVWRIYIYFFMNLTPRIFICCHVFIFFNSFIFWKRKGNRRSSFSSPFYLRFYRHLLPGISFPGWCSRLPTCLCLEIFPYFQSPLSPSCLKTESCKFMQLMWCQSQVL